MWLEIYFEKDDGLEAPDTGAIPILYGYSAVRSRGAKLRRAGSEPSCARKNNQTTRSHPVPAPRPVASSPPGEARWRGSCDPPNAQSWCGPGRAGAAVRGSRSSPTSSASRKSPAAEPSTSCRSKSPRCGAGWAVAADADETNPEPIELLLVSGDEAAGNPDVRALAEDAKRVIVLTMFHELAAGWADLILPATAALERDGTSMNLEGRVQRLRRAAFPPCPDELAWISKLAERFDVDVPPHAMGVFAELAEHAFRDLSLDELGAHAPLPARHAYVAPAPATTPAPGRTPAPD